MKWLLLLLAIGRTASEKLDRTYLPPPGAQYAGGNVGDIQIPLELPHRTQHGTLPTGLSFTGPQNFETNGQPPLTPITTYETTMAPINAVTGLPVQNLDNQQHNQNFPDYAYNQGKIIPNISQFPVQGGKNRQDPGSVFQQPSIDGNVSGYHVNSQIHNQNPGQTTSPQLPGQYQTPYSFSNKNTVPGQQNFMSTAIAQKITPSNLPDNGQISQGSYSGQPINVKYSRKPEITNGYSNDNRPESDAHLLQPGGIGQQNLLRPDSDLGQNIYKPIQEYNSIPSTTPITETYASTISPLGSSIRPERPQAATDRNAIILSYENVRGPNSYSYSYDTSNGIHADETGIVNDGTKAHGSYSYTGDDGKIYTVTYTADENGFQPRGDHIPTPPPVPEAIREVIEQAARDKEAGIIDDGSYDENKYGDKKYHDFANHRQLPTFKTGDKQKYGQIKPVSRKDNDEQYESPIEDQFTKTVFADDNKEHFPGNTKQQPENGDTSVHNVDDQQSYRQTSNSNVNNEPTLEEKLTSKDNFSGRRPISFNRIKYTMPNSGSQVQEYDDSGVNIDIEDTYDYDSYNVDSPNIKEQENFPKFKTSVKNNFPVIYNRKEASKLSSKGKKQPGSLKEDNDTPQIQSQQTDFPSRFNNQDVRLNKRPVLKSSDRGTSARPFIMPEVYNQQSESTKYQKQPSTSTTSHPFNENEGDQDNYDYPENNSPKRIPGQKVTLPSRTTYQTSTTSRPQYTRPEQKTRLTQKGTLRPSQNDYSINVTPDSTYTSSTLTPISNQRFGSTVSPQRPTRPYNQQYPSTTGLSTVEGRPVPSQESNYEYKKSRKPVSDHVVPSPYPTFGSRLQSKQNQHNAQYYPTSTYVPTSTTAVPTTPKYQQAYAPSGISGPYQPGSTDATQTGYYYEPVQPEYSLTVRPQTSTSGSYSVTTPGNYPTTHAQHPSNIIHSTENPSTSGITSTFILDGSGYSVPEVITNGPYQTTYQYSSTTPLNVPSSVTSRPGYGTYIGDEPPGSHSLQSNQYTTTAPIYSTTGSQTTIGTTPSSIISSSPPDQSKAGYPSYPSAQGSYSQQPLVDGYGRPISYQQQSNYSPPGAGFGDESGSKRPGSLITVFNASPIEDISGDSVNNSRNFDGPSPNYPGYNNRSNVLGEDFSGPKQPQSYDPKTGYHYK